MGWSGDTVTLRPRPLNFGDLHEHLRRVEADVVLLCFGRSRVLDGGAGLQSFRAGLDALLAQLAERRYGAEPPRLALISPIAYEDLGPPLPAGDLLDHNLQLYGSALRAAAREHAIAYVDLLEPLRRAYAASRNR